jgi:serine/threonine-protein kinase
MTCPSCNSPLEPTARFCGVCGYRLAPARPASQISGGMPKIVERTRAPSQGGGQVRAPNGESKKPIQAVQPPKQGAPPQQQQRPPSAKPRPKSGDEIYIDQVLNNRFKVESKIGEGGFGAVYRGVQLATGRKVALKLLHPEMTKDENLVARFRREGMVLCNLRDAHTITTYDFDQTPDGTLYIAMELLEGKSLHEVFHQDEKLDWRRVFKILTEMCSSLAEAHAQGIVHRDLKPENIYLESRPGNPEFVKILDFGIAKVMRGDTIDPQSPQLTATGQTLGTLEYMSPEQLMGKPLDGRSDVYALGVLAYEMITGRLPFPDAKGPAGLITAQLKQTPQPPSQALPSAGLPKAADRAILKCLEKDKNNRFPDVSALAAALQDVIANAGKEQSELAAIQAMQIPGANQAPHNAIDMLETRRGELPNLAPPPIAPHASTRPGMGERGALASGSPPHMLTPSPIGSPIQAPPPVATPPTGSPYAPRPMTPTPPPPYGGMHGGMHAPMVGHGGGMPSPLPSYAPPSYPAMPQQRSRLIWWVLALLAIGAGVGTALALVFSK